MRTITKYILDSADLKQAIIGYLRDEDGGSPGKLVGMTLKREHEELPEAFLINLKVEVECEE